MKAIITICEHPSGCDLKDYEFIKPIIKSGEHCEYSTLEHPNTWSDEADWKQQDDAQRYRDLKS
jgi:hypothetical protein